jgi:hypothetical protein
MTAKNWSITDEELETQITNAKEATKKSLLNTARVKSVYCTKTDEQSIVVNLSLINGALVSFPVHLVKELKDANEISLKDQWISHSGDSIHWESLDFDIHTEDLIKRVTSNNN